MINTNRAFAEQNNAPSTRKNHLQSSFDHACAILLLLRMDFWQTFRFVFERSKHLPCFITNLFQNGFAGSRVSAIAFYFLFRKVVVNVWLPCPCHVVAPAILQSLIVPLCSPHSCCVVLPVSECNTAKCSFSAVCPPWEAFDQLRCCVRVSLLACSAPWLSGVLNELKPGFLQIVFSRIRRRVHDKGWRDISI